MPYSCNNCSRSFDEPRDYHTTYESYLGLVGFLDSTNITIKLCPYCGSEEIDYEEE